MLYLVSTPIGNFEDITLRAQKILTEVNVIVCEDTRETTKLLKHFSIPHKPLISLYEENEVSRISDLIVMLKADQSIALVSDSGTPLISDPGFKFVREALAQGIKVVPIPGPVAAITALSASGLPTDKFLFLGFLPEKSGHREQLLQNTQTSLNLVNSTVIIYVSPYKISGTLESIQKIFGDIEIVILREMTKIYEERWMGKISEAMTKFSSPKGEFVLLFHLTDPK